MRNILAKGGVEFLAVFLGIALSLWVDDYRQEKELNNRIIDDYRNIYSEVLNIIQAATMRKISQKKYYNIKEKKYLNDALMTSIAGISAAMKNTG